MLTVKNLNKTYSDGTQALTNISLDLPKGMVGLLGPNGAGKSTLMRTLACIQAIENGKVQFGDIDLSNNPHQLRQILGYLPQQFGVYPHMSCEALLKHIAVLKGLSASEIATQIPKLLEDTNLTSVAKRKVSHFSGGMRQRFGIAQALLGDPKLVILDEPTAGLDPQERERLHEVLVTLSKDKLVLLSTHIVEDIENLCHYVALMKGGKVLDANATQALTLPLEGTVWNVPLDVKLPNEAVVLNKQYRFGHPSLRVFSRQSPHTSATPAVATLQDRYFLALSEEGDSCC